MGRHVKGVEEFGFPRRGVEQDALGVVVVRMPGTVAGSLAGELGDVGVELVEVGRFEGCAVVEAAGVVKFRVEDDLAVGVFEGHVGDHAGHVR